MRAMLDLLLPPICGRCGRNVESGAALCPPCDLRLVRWEEQLPTPAGLVSCSASLRYVGDTIDWVHRFKYPRPGLSGLDPAAMCVLRAAMREVTRNVPGPRAALVVPIPLHPRRLRARGFNPAAELARFVAREAGIERAASALVRVRDTRSQTGLDRAARQRNLRGAFRPRSRMPDRVWLIDDVVTTGSTLTEAARALRLAGAKSVRAVCAARTPAPP